MKRLVAVVALLVALAAATVVRPHEPWTVQGPEGDMKIRLVGDEWSHRWETVDGGFTVASTDGSTWRYVQEDGVTLSDTRPGAPHVVLASMREGTPLDAGHKATVAAHSKRGAFQDVAASATGPFTSATHISGTIPFMVIAVNFTNSRLVHGGRAWIDRLFTGSHSLNAFYELQSYNTTHFGPARENCGVPNDGIVEIYLPVVHPNQSFALEMQATYLAIQAVSQCVDFDVFDVDGDGWISSTELQVAFIFAGSEGASGCLSYKCPTTWAHQASDPAGVQVGNKKIGGAIYMSETVDCDCTMLNTIGTLCHEMGHALGLPDQYDVFAANFYGPDTTLNAFWSLMNGGNWCGMLPCNLDPWSRAYLGWVNPQLVSGETRVTITTLGTNKDTDVYQLRSAANGRPWIWDVAAGDGEFFLIENRKAVVGEFDENAPASGVLVWQIRYGITEYNVINSQFGHMIDVLPACGIKTPAGSPYDTWPMPPVASLGSGPRYTWSCTTTPNTTLASGEHSCHNMNVSGPVSDVMEVLFNFDDPACAGKCCGNGEIEMGEECEVGYGCDSTCKCTDGWTPYLPPALICNGTAKGNTSKLCGSRGCPVDWLSNGKCDPLCMYEAECNYDLADCPYSQCTACPFERIGNQLCEEDCFAAEDCAFDKYDCFPPARLGNCSTNCTAEMIYNGVCDKACDTPSCYYDAGQCLKGCPVSCWFGNLGDGTCQAGCDWEGCKWDGGDCPTNCPAACTNELKHNNVCDAVCNVAECKYDLGKCTPPSSDNDEVGAASRLLNPYSNVVALALATVVLAIAALF